jgi:hypothetical protein
MAAAEIYAQCLLPLKEGYPLYRPELHFRLNDDVYDAYRSKGISIGDIGIIRPGGDFDFLFNICSAPGSNSGDAPDTPTIAERLDVTEPPEPSNSGSLDTIGASEQLRVTSTVAESDVLGRNSATLSAVREEFGMSERMQHPTLLGPGSNPTGGELISAGRISITPNYVSRDHPYLAHGREEQMSFNAEANFNPIT